MLIEPRTDWKERETPGEAARVEALTAQLVSMQQTVSAAEGKGRALHRKQVLGLNATLEVLGDLPAHARHGIFESPGTRDALVRLSNGAAKRQGDAVPDVRGFALKVLGVEGPSALGSGTTDCQDILCINASRFAFPSGIDFLEFVVAMGRSPGAALWYMLGRYGFGAFGRLSALKKGISKPFSGFATETFHSTNPLACGAHAMKLRLSPTHGQAPGAQPLDLAEDVAARLRKGPLTFDLQAQFFVSEAATPIENADQDWAEADAPFVTVARLVLPQQDPASAEGRATAARCEGERFDPWRALL
ncbi:MAG: catalase, partial [Deltaproteobacteria bacterium]